MIAGIYPPGGNNSGVFDTTSNYFNFPDFSIFAIWFSVVSIGAVFLLQLHKFRLNCFVFTVSSNSCWAVISSEE